MKKMGLYQFCTYWCFMQDYIVVVNLLCCFIFFALLCVHCDILILGCDVHLYILLVIGRSCALE